MKSTMLVLLSRSRLKSKSTTTKMDRERIERLCKARS